MLDRLAYVPLFPLKVPGLKLVKIHLGGFEYGLKLFFVFGLMIDLITSNFKAISISLSRVSSVSFYCKKNFICFSSLLPLASMSITRTPF